MDLLNLLDFNLILLFIVLLLCTYSYLSWPYNYWKKLGVPGPWPVPIFGVCTELIHKSLIENDENMIKKYGKVFGFYEGWLTALMAADPDIVKEVCVKLSPVFHSRRELLWRGPLKYSVFDQTGSHWKRLRSLSTPFFTSGKLKMNSKRVTAVLDQVNQFLEEKCCQKADIEAKEFSGRFTMDVICNVVFGIDTNTLLKKEHPLTENAKKSMSDFGPHNPWFMFTIFFPVIARFFERFEVSFFRREPLDYITELCKKLLHEKQQGNKEAEIFVTALVKAHEEELDYESKQALGETENVKYKGMTEAEILGQAMLFVFAGYDTTSNTLSFLLHSLVMDQDVQQTLYEEIHSQLGDQPVTYDNVQNIDYLSWCIDETLRMYPPVPRTDRQCYEDGVTVAGIPLKKGHVVVFPIWYLQHQPDVWPDPYKFDPLRFSPEVKKDRHPYYFLPFGIGPRNCIGIRLALLEIKMFIVTVLQKYKLVPNSKTVPVVLDKKPLFTTAKDGLWFSAERRQ